MLPVKRVLNEISKAKDEMLTPQEMLKRAENIDGHMIFGMTGRQCQTTIAGGKLLMQDRQLVGIDEEAENAHILEAAKKLWGSLNNRVY